MRNIFATKLNFTNLLRAAINCEYCSSGLMLYFKISIGLSPFVPELLLLSLSQQDTSHVLCCKALTLLCSGTVVIKQRLADASGLAGPSESRSVRRWVTPTMIGELGTMSDEISSTLVLSTRQRHRRLVDRGWISTAGQKRLKQMCADV